MKKSSRFDLYDQHNHFYVKLINTKTGWERHISIDNVNWKLTHSKLTMTEMMTIKQDVIDNNFKNLFNKIIKDE